MSTGLACNVITLTVILDTYRSLYIQIAKITAVNMCNKTALYMAIYTASRCGTVRRVPYSCYWRVVSVCEEAKQDGVSSHAQSNAYDS